MEEENWHKLINECMECTQNHTAQSHLQGGDLLPGCQQTASRCQLLWVCHSCREPPHPRAHPSNDCSRGLESGVLGREALGEPKGLDFSAQ